MKTFDSRAFKIATIATIGIAALAAMNFPPVNSAVKNFVYTMLKPVQGSFWVAGAQIYGVIEPLAKAGSLAADNERLRYEVNDLLVKDSQIQDLKKENENLRQGLNLELEKDYDLKLVGIVGKNIALDALIIDKGSKDMVETGMPVITAQKALVGKVSKVYENFSEVTLATNKNFSFDVKIGSDGIDGLVKGSGGFAASIDLVPKDKNLKNGDSVVTSTLGGIFPAGLIVGTVEEIAKNDVASFQTAGIDMAFNINDSQSIFVASGKYPLGLQEVSLPPSRANKK
jgi:rod shape-determining protein MreC